MIDCVSISFVAACYICTVYTYLYDCEVVFLVSVNKTIVRINRSTDDVHFIVQVTVNELFTDTAYAPSLLNSKKNQSLRGLPAGSEPSTPSPSLHMKNAVHT